MGLTKPTPQMPHILSYNPGYRTLRVAGVLTFRLSGAGKLVF